jgi:serine/threonine-protein kinase
VRVIDRQRWLVLEPLLDQALDLAPDERARWLNEVSITSPDVAEDLAALLRRQDAVERTGFLERTADVTLAGLELGGWTLERPLGQGGAGSVWLARRSDGRFDGLAAVKLLNLELLSQSGRERFRHEGSVLARLTHPGIARLLDAGVSPSGQPYLVLEHVDGEPIDAYVRARALRKEDCVSLFLQVLDAVAHAHASLIVHRDLKPSNILVTGDGRVKLLDFGIATLLDAPVVEGSIALTPQFAAPEQALGAPVTTATDVYSAGVLLYLLLAGRHPTAEGCQSPPEIFASLHATEPARLGFGDLDIVLARALKKEPTARYGGIQAFSDDLVRWLHHHPIRARPYSLGYHARMFARRNRALVAAAAAVVVLAGAYVEAVINDRERVRAALAEATLATRKAEQVTDFAVSLFEPTGRGGTIADSVTERDLLAYGTARARELSAQPVVEAQMLDLIGRIHTEMGDFAGARPILERALTLRRSALGEDHPDVATSEMHLARLESDATDVATFGAVRLVRHAYEIRLRTFGPEDVRTIDALYELATALHISGDFAGARPLFNRWTATVEHQPTLVTEERAKQLSDMATFLQMGGQLDRAERLMKQALTVSRALWGEQHHRVGEQLTHLGGILTDEKKYASSDSVLRIALALLRTSYPDGHPEVGYALRNIAQNFEDWEQPEQARPVWLEAAAMYRRFNGERSMGFANATMHVGYAELRLGQYVQAEQTLRVALSQLKGLSAAAPVAARARVHLGEALAGQKRFAEAESLMLPEYRRLVGVKGLLGNGRGWAAAGLVRLYEAWGRPAEAAKYRAEARH